VLRNAALEFGHDSVVEVQSRFENCTITLVDGAHLTIGEDGALAGCRITGPGDIVVLGRFEYEDGGPAILGPRRVLVGAGGELACAILQHVERTQFAFESGCVLRLNIHKAR
jgi:hypothetical protein